MRKKHFFACRIHLKPQLCELRYLSRISTEHSLSSPLRQSKSRKIADVFTHGWEGCPPVKDLTSLTPLYSAGTTHKVLNGWCGLLKSHHISELDSSVWILHVITDLEMEGCAASSNAFNNNFFFTPTVNDQVDESRLTASGRPKANTDIFALLQCDKKTGSVSWCYYLQSPFSCAKWPVFVRCAAQVGFCSGKLLAQPVSLQVPTC